MRLLRGVLFGFILSGLTAPTALAQNTLSATDVASFITQFQKAFQTCDVPFMRGLMGDQITAMGIRGGLAKGPDVDDFQRQCAQGVKFALNFERLHDEALGPVHHLIVGKATGTMTGPNGKTIPTSIKFTWVLTRQGERVVMQHSHLSALM
ncbi:nuclear transport factor 2 family protein [Niveispirillum lacus]|uniref:nuclear transport factor 2 family protein n=1 Tax=Niveispirillum lacus TaxID=1981099 RepID=UPI0013FD8C61|nr:nuclear transport factor 2 family protein [Niveispirillum lacus]